MHDILSRHMASRHALRADSAWCHREESEDCAFAKAHRVVMLVILK
jgi:hypothetical protein